MPQLPYAVEVQRPTYPKVKYIKWPCDWNRPLSREEREIAKRLDTAPDAGVVIAPQSWVSALGGKKADETLLPEEA